MGAAARSLSAFSRFFLRAFCLLVDLLATLLCDTSPQELFMEWRIESQSDNCILFEVALQNILDALNSARCGSPHIVLGTLGSSLVAPTPPFLSDPPPPVDF